MAVLLVTALLWRVAIGSGDNPMCFSPLFLLVPSILPRIRSLLLLSALSPRSIRSLLSEAAYYLLPKRQEFQTAYPQATRYG